jgi:hypothetical protein
MKRILLIAVVVGVVWALGVFAGWWGASWRSVAASLAVLWAFAAGQSTRIRGGSGVPSAEEVNHVIAQLHDDRQDRRLRHLGYRVAAVWPNDRADEGVWTGVKFLVGDFMVARYAVSPIIDEENLTAAAIQAYAMHHYAEQGARLVRNELTSLGGHPCAVFEAQTSRGMERRISFTVHRSEYMVRFTCDFEAQFRSAIPLMDALTAACEIVLPNLQTVAVLGGQTGIGVPTDWTLVKDDPHLASWRAKPGPLDVTLHCLASLPPGDPDIGTFARVQGFRPRPDARLSKYRFMGDCGPVLVHRLGGARSIDGMERWAMEALRLPGGQTVVLETENHGEDTDQWHGLLLEPIRHVLLATIKDAALTVI